MQTSTNLGLTLTEASDGSLVKFLQWRLAINGLSSNMTIIDDWAGKTNACLVDLSSQLGIVYVYAAYSAGTLYNATINNISALYAGIIIDLSLNKTSVTGTQLDINGYGAKNLYKINGNGNYVVVEAGDLVINRHYLFYFDGSRWIWINATSSDQISISGSANRLIVATSASAIGVSNISASSIMIGNLRYGGNSTNWHVAGSTVYNASMKVQVGQYRNDISFDGLTSGSVRIYYPESYSGVPNVFLDLIGDDGAGSYPFILARTSGNAETSFVLEWKSPDLIPINFLNVSWFSIGPR